MNNDPPTDETLIQSTLAGDDEAFAELVRRHKRKVFAMASRFARDYHQLDDLGQEIFIRVYRKLCDFRGDAPFEHWLSRLAVNVCYDFVRKNRHSVDQVSLDSFDPPAEAASADSNREASEELERAMSQLSPKERLVITLLELEEKTVREVAALTGWSVANVKVRAFRARQELKKILSYGR